MLYDAHELMKSGKPFPDDIDICIIGSGAAGLTIASEFLGTKNSVVVLESSKVSTRHNPPAGYREALNQRGALPWPVPTHRFDDAKVQTAYAGLSDTDEPQSADFFVNQRIRVYGGTTNCWGGWTRPLAGDLDFDRGETFPQCKWPIPASALDRGYTRAMYYCSLMERSAADYDKPTTWLGDTVDTIATLETESTGLRTAVFTQMYNGNMQHEPYDGRLDFQLIWGPALEAEGSNVSIYRNVNVVSLEYKDGRIDKVTARSVVDGEAGPAFTVTAKKFILATSCIENARLLLLSQPGMPADLLSPALGRYLFTHPMIDPVATFTVGQVDEDTVKRADIARFYNPPWPELKKPVDWKPAAFAALAPTPKVARDNHIGNFRALVFFGWKGTQGSVNFAWEQFADFPNRIYLDPDKTHHDLFGSANARATLKLSPWDTGTLKTGLELVRAGLEKMGVAVPGSWARTPNPTYLPGAHAMGTTRMATTKEAGVVDENCLVHGLTNLYVAGSSVFPTGGCANPTLTVIALAIRLADHLKTLP